MEEQEEEEKEGDGDGKGEWVQGEGWKDEEGAEKRYFLDDEGEEDDYDHSGDLEFLW